MNKKNKLTPFPSTIIAYINSEGLDSYIVIYGFAHSKIALSVNIIKTSAGKLDIPNRGPEKSLQIVDSHWHLAMNA